MLGETFESLLQLPLFDETTIKQWNDNPSIFNKYVEDNKFVAVQNANEDDLCLLKAVSSAGATRTFHSLVPASVKPSRSYLRHRLGVTGQQDIIHFQHVMVKGLHPR